MGLLPGVLASFRITSQLSGFPACDAPRVRPLFIPAESAGSSPARQVRPSQAPVEADTQQEQGGAERALVLLVEDNKGDVFLFKEALAEYHVDAEVVVTLDGEQAINLIQRLSADPDARCPRLVVLDLNLPKRNGHEVLSYLRKNSKFSTLHVIVFSSSNADKDRESAMREGANEYICKPSSLSAFLEIGRTIAEALGQAPDSKEHPEL